MNEGAVRHVEHVMGTTVSFDIRGVRDVHTYAALDEAIGWLHHVDATFSTYRDDSEVTRFARGELGADDLSPDVVGVLAWCLELTDVTDGAFNAFDVPAPNGTMLDPSGLVKGWSVERAAVLLEAAGLRDFCINAGGDVAVRGRPAPDRSWRVGVRHPDRADRLATSFDLIGPVAVATSGTYERGAHIVDPRNGSRPNELASVTVVGRDLGTADAFATAMFVLGSDGLVWIAEQPGYEAMVITRDERVRRSAGFPRSALAG